jgi:hypothetical protein
VLYEPVPFALLVRAAPQSAAAREIIAVRGRSSPSGTRFPWARAARGVPGDRGAGHMAPVTQPQRINPLIERFLLQA